MTVKTYKILMISALFPPDFGGAAVQALRLAKALQQKKVAVEFLTDNGSEPLSHDFYEGVRVTRVKTLSENSHKKFREIVFAFKVFLFVLFRPDLNILHFHSINGFESIFFPLYRLMGKKIVLKVTLPGIDDPLAFKNRRFFGKLFFWGLCCANKIVAISRELVELSHLAGIPDKQVQLIFNGIDALRFSSVSAKEKFEIRRVLGINENAFVFMSIGTIEYRKGYDLLLAAYCRILKKIPNAELIIIGPGNVDSNNYYKELISYIDKFNLKNVKFSGKQFGIDDYLKSADCFLFCSRQEGFGTVIIESMSCGIPTVAMNIPCVTADIITDERIGVICYSGVANDFADLTLNFLNRIDEALLQDAASRVQAKYSIDKIADEYILIYEYILSLK